MNNTEEKKTKRKKLFLYLGMGLSVMGVVSTAVGVYCSGVRNAYNTGYSDGTNDSNKINEDKLNLIKELKEDEISKAKEEFKEMGFDLGMTCRNSVTSRRLKEAYDEGYKDGEFHEKYRLLDELSTPDLSVPEQRYLAGCCDIKLVKMRDGEGEMMLSNHTNPRAENSIAMMKELRRNSL